VWTEGERERFSILWEQGLWKDERENTTKEERENERGERKGRGRERTENLIQHLTGTN